MSEAGSIQVEAIGKRFGALQAVDGVSFAVAPGEIFGLLGPNGAGKSTLIRMLTTLVPPTTGTAKVAGYDVITQPNEVRHAIGVIPQNMTSDPDLTCLENLAIHARFYGMPRKQRYRVSMELLESVNLGDRAQAFARTLSGGMRRRLEIARGLVHQPRILFLDEPTTGLDPVSRMAVWEMITGLREQRGLTLFLTTHYMDEADRLCDRLAIVDRGKVVALDSPAALKAAIPGAAVIEARLEPDLDDGLEALQRLTAVRDAAQPAPALYRLFSDHGPSTAVALVELTRARRVELKSLSIQSTSLDDVFVHYTGRGLSEAGADDSPRNGKRGHGGRR